MHSRSLRGRVVRPRVDDVAAPSTSPTRRQPCARPGACSFRTARSLRSRSITRPVAPSRPRRRWRRSFGRWFRAWPPRAGAMPALACRVGSTRPVFGRSLRASGDSGGGRKTWPCRRTTQRMMESALESLAQLPGATEDELRAGLTDLRSLPHQPGPASAGSSASRRGCGDRMSSRPRPVRPSGGPARHRSRAAGAEGGRGARQGPRLDRHPHRHRPAQYRVPVHASHHRRSPPEADDRRHGFAGVVEEVGAAVTEFRLGDEVFGFEGGANAEYVTVRESGVIAPKPAELTFEQAAAVPDGSLLALTFIRRGYRRRASSSTAPRARSEPRSSSSSCTTSGRTSRRCATGRTSSSCSRSARGRSTIVFARTSRAAVRRMT